MDEHAMIAFLPTDTSWCRQGFPHMTLVYAGKIEDRSLADFNTMAKDAITVARMMRRPFSLQVTGVQTLGPDGEQVDALMLHPTPELLAARKIVEYWNKSEFKELLPHATIGPAGSAANNPMTGDKYEVPGNPGYPLSLYFNQVVASWGEQRLVFDLRGMDY